MKIEIEIDDVDVIEDYDTYAHEYKNAQDGHRRWGRITWLYKGDLIAEISGESARKIQEAIKEEHERRNT